MHLTNKTFTDQVVELTGKYAWVLGPDLRFVRCRIVSQLRGRNLIINQAEFDNCEIVTTHRQVQVNWNKSKVDSCRFVGAYRGCEFGSRPEATRGIPGD